MDRKKDLIISGGFNIYPSDLEAVLAQHPGGRRLHRDRRAVRGMGRDAGRLLRAATPASMRAPTRSWRGPTPSSARRSACPRSHAIDELPRSAIGKVLKRELRDRLAERTPHDRDLRRSSTRWSRSRAAGAATIPDDWLQGRTAYGGLSAALALHAAQQSDVDLPPLRSAQVAFIGPLSGEVTIRATGCAAAATPPSSRPMSKSEAGLGLRATFVFMARSTSRVDHRGRQRARLRRCRRPDDADLHAATARRSSPATSNCSIAATDSVGPAEWLRWARLRERDGLDPMVELIAIADCLPPAAFKLLGGPAPLSSMTWHGQPARRRSRRRSDGWWLLRADAPITRATAVRASRWRSGTPTATPVAEADAERRDLRLTLAAATHSRHICDSSSRLTHRVRQRGSIERLSRAESSSPLTGGPVMSKTDSSPGARG